MRSISSASGTSSISSTMSSNYQSQTIPLLATPVQQKLDWECKF